jgi:hypothetical protein
MNENGTPPANGGGIAGDAPLAQNEYVQQLFSILQDNGRSTAGLSAIAHITKAGAVLLSATPLYFLQLRTSILRRNAV